MFGMDKYPEKGLSAYSYILLYTKTAVFARGYRKVFCGLGDFFYKKRASREGEACGRAEKGTGGNPHGYDTTKKKVERVWPSFVRDTTYSRTTEPPSEE